MQNLFFYYFICYTYTLHMCKSVHIHSHLWFPLNTTVKPHKKERKMVTVFPTRITLIKSRGNSCWKENFFALPFDAQLQPKVFSFIYLFSF